MKREDEKERSKDDLFLPHLSLTVMHLERVHAVDSWLDFSADLM